MRRREARRREARRREEARKEAPRQGETQRKEDKESGRDWQGAGRQGGAWNEVKRQILRSKGDTLTFLGVGD